jgi:hypothetical protein
MTQLLQARHLNLRDLIDQFGVRVAKDEKFFGEWQTELPELSDLEMEFLDAVKAGYINLAEYPPVLEKSFQLAVVSPLLLLAGFYLSPFRIRTEESVEIMTEDEGITVRGSIDVLVIKNNFWVLVIESKQTFFSPEVGLAQLLAYMLATPNPEKPCFGMIAAGGSFLFVKMTQSDRPAYALSDQYVLRKQRNELYPVLQILKRLGQL